MNIRDVNNDAKYHKEKALQIIQEAIDNQRDSINLSHLTDLKELPQEILNIPHLKHLDIEQCYHITLPEWLGELKSLETLITDARWVSCIQALQNLRNLRLGEMDFNLYLDELVTLTNLECLDCDIEDDGENMQFPESFAKLQKLQSLDISYNPFNFASVCKVLSKIPYLTKLRVIVNGDLRNLYKLQALEELDFSFSEYLEQLPESIGDLQNLKVLNLSSDTDYMRLKELPDSFYTLCNLEELYLYDCKYVTHFKDTFKNLKSIKKIHTVGSSIKTIPFSEAQLNQIVDLAIQGDVADFSLCKNLQKFYYYKSAITGNAKGDIYGIYEEYNFHGANIEKLNKLESLRLFGGKITDTSFISSLKNLKHLYIICDIESLPEDIGNLENLQTLELSYALSLKTLPKSIKKLKNLKNFHITQRNKYSLPTTIEELQIV